MRVHEHESGQATVEWVGLVLGVALVFVALLAGGRGAAKGESGRELGGALAERITCAVRGACAGAVPRAGRAPAKRGTAERSAAERSAAERGRRSPLNGPLAVSPYGGRSGVSRGVTSRAGKSSPLRGLLRALGWPKGFVKRTWLPCMGLRSWQYDREHPRPLGSGLPWRESVKRVNECANPLSFVFDG